METLYARQIELIKSASDNLFSQVDDRVQLIESKLVKLHQSISGVREQLAEVTSDEQKGKATCFWSTSSYPLSDTVKELIEPIERVGLRSTRGDSSASEITEYRTLLASLPSQARDDSNYGVDNTDAKFDQMLSEVIGRQPNTVSGFQQESELVTPLGKQAYDWPVGRLDDIKSVSSLLVHHTYESRLVNAQSYCNSHLFGDKARIVRSMTSGSSGAGYGLHLNQLTASRSARSRTAKKQASASGGTESEEHSLSAAAAGHGTGPLASDLGPAPASILKYHHDNFIEPDMLDSLTGDIFGLNEQSSLLDGGDDSSGLLITSALPDLLPSLSGIVQDVKQQQPYHSAQFESNSLLGDTSSAREAARLQTSTPLDEASSSTPAPPPPPLPNLFADLGQQQQQRQEQQRDDSPRTPSESHYAEAPPPPPPPPPPGHLLPAETPRAEAPDKADEPSDSGSRGALLAEIRAAASKPRRKVTTRTSRPPLADNDEGAEVSQSAQAGASGGRGAQSGLRTAMSASDPRDSLLASIRMAAGKPAAKRSKAPQRDRLLEAKLERKRQSSGGSGGVGDESADKQAASASASGGGGDLMSDLVNKLRARRDGISGTLNLEARMTAEPLDTAQKRVMTQVSRLIPEMSRDDSSGATARQSARSSRRRRYGEDEAEGESDDDDDEDDDWNA